MHEIAASVNQNLTQIYLVSLGQKACVGSNVSWIMKRRLKRDIAGGWGRSFGRDRPLACQGLSKSRARRTGRCVRCDST